VGLDRGVTRSLSGCWRLARAGAAGAVVGTAAGVVVGAGGAGSSLVDGFVGHWCLSWHCYEYWYCCWLCGTWLAGGRTCF